MKHSACRRATELISLSMDRPLSRAESRSLRGHMILCRSCRTFQKQIHEIREFLRAAGAPTLRSSYLSTTLSPEAKERLRTAVSLGSSPQ